MVLKIKILILSCFYLNNFVKLQVKKTSNHTFYDLWIHHKIRYNLYFDREEDSKRIKIFQNNLNFIYEHNKNAKIYGYTLKMNHLGHFVLFYLLCLIIY